MCSASRYVPTGRIRCRGPSLLALHDFKSHYTGLSVPVTTPVLVPAVTVDFASSNG